MEGIPNPADRDGDIFRVGIVPGHSRKTIFAVHVNPDGPPSQPWSAIFNESGQDQQLQAEDKACMLEPMYPRPGEGNQLGVQTD